MSAPAVRLPVVRVRALPHAGEALAWDEGPDWPAAAAVLLVAVVGLALACAALVRALQGDGDVAAAWAGAAPLGAVCLAALVFSAGECRHREYIRIHDGAVHLRRRTLVGSVRWSEPLCAYAGLECRDRRRRLFVRNQDRPPTGRRGPVSEFVVVLRHASAATRDLELFRAQPSLETLRAMHAAGGDARTAGACAERAAGYRDALATLARRLRKPALVAAPGGGLDAVDARALNAWLEPGTASRQPRQLPA